MPLKPFTVSKYRRRVFSQIWMLALQFVLGMVLNLLGEDTKGFAHGVYETVLVVHILNALGLVEGAIYIVLKRPSRLAWWTTFVLALTFMSGVLTVRTEQDSWSFVMAIGFVASAWLNGILYVRADRQLHSSK
jgi:hypothetical protein